MDRSSNSKETNKSKTDKRNLKPYIQNVIHLHDHVLQICFTDGTSKQINFLPALISSRIFFKYIPLSKFQKFKFNQFRIYWQGNVLDFYVDYLYDWNADRYKPVH
jgi:hypothetical protein